MAGSRQSKIIYRFAQFCLDLGRGTLCGPDGNDLALRPKAFALLQYLLDNPDRLHSRDGLFCALWPGVAVSDDSLTQCVSDLRRAFGDRASQVLRTVPRRGYMLNADVERQDIESNAPPRLISPPVMSAGNPEMRRSQPTLRREAIGPIVHRRREGR